MTSPDSIRREQETYTLEWAYGAFMYSNPTREEYSEVNSGSATELDARRSSPFPRDDV